MPLSITSFQSFIDSPAFWTLLVLFLRLISCFRPAARTLLILGYAEEQRNNAIRAEQAYKKGLHAARSSTRIGDVRWLQMLQFMLERSRHRRGASSAVDSLFDCTYQEITRLPAGVSYRDRSGYFRLEYVYTGVKIIGLVLSGKNAPEELVLYLDNTPLRRIKLSKKGIVRRFDIPITRRTLRQFPRESVLSIRSTDERALVTFRGNHAVRLGIPHGKGAILSVLEHGYGLDKKGGVAASSAERAQRQNQCLELYHRAEQFFVRDLGKPLFLLYGTLLGYFREGDFIPGDDDFDVGYLSDRSDPLMVKEEAKTLIRSLVQAGFTVTFNGQGRLFRLSMNDLGGAQIHLDVNPVWFQDRRVWIHNQFSALAGKSDFLPLERGTLRTTPVLIPRCTEWFLEQNYGPEWRVPDPGFVYRRSDTSQSELKNFDRALITPPEYRALREEIDRDRSSAPGTGCFCAIVWDDLYPGIHDA